jgi:hypothetical protein
MTSRQAVPLLAAATVFAGLLACVASWGTCATCSAGRPRTIGAGGWALGFPAAGKEGRQEARAEGLRERVPSHCSVPSSVLSPRCFFCGGVS